MNKQTIGTAAILTGLVGALYGLGLVEASMDTPTLLTGVGISFTSAMLLYVGQLFVRDEI